MWRNYFWKFWEKWSGFVIGAILIIVGCLILIFWQKSLARDFGILTHIWGSNRNR